MVLTKLKDIFDPTNAKFKTASQNGGKHIYGNGKVCLFHQLDSQNSQPGKLMNKWLVFWLTQLLLINSQFCKEEVSNPQPEQNSPVWPKPDSNVIGGNVE